MASRYAGAGSTSVNNNNSTFQIPAIYSFPPFFTVQPTDATRAAQMEEWRRFFLSWAAYEKVTSIVIQQWPFWENTTLNRRLPQEGIDLVVNALVSQGNAEWIDGGANSTSSSSSNSTKTTLRIFYKSPAEWAAIITARLNQLSYSGQLVTLYDFRTGIFASGTPFEGLDPETTLRALTIVEAQGKIDIISASSSSGGGIGTDDVGDDEKVGNIDETGIRFK